MNLDRLKWSRSSRELWYRRILKGALEATLGSALFAGRRNLARLTESSRRDFNRTKFEAHLLLHRRFLPVKYRRNRALFAIVIMQNLEASITTLAAYRAKLPALLAQTLWESSSMSPKQTTLTLVVPDEPWANRHQQVSRQT